MGRRLSMICKPRREIKPPATTRQSRVTDSNCSHPADVSDQKANRSFAKSSARQRETNLSAPILRAIDTTGARRFVHDKRSGVVGLICVIWARASGKPLRRPNGYKKLVSRRWRELNTTSPRFARRPTADRIRWGTHRGAEYVTGDGAPPKRASTSRISRYRFAGSLSEYTINDATGERW